jgi:transcriptional regulator with XRE-family HTH domain
VENFVPNAWIDLRKLRTSRGWSQRKAADELGFSRAYLSAVENSKRSVSLKMMAAIIKVFRVKYEDFYAVSEQQAECSA